MAFALLLFWVFACLSVWVVEFVGCLLRICFWDFECLSFGMFGFLSCWVFAFFDCLGFCYLGALLFNTRWVVESLMFWVSESSSCCIVELWNWWVLKRVDFLSFWVHDCFQFLNCWVVDWLYFFKECLSVWRSLFLSCCFVCVFSFELFDCLSCWVLGFSWVFELVECFEWRFYMLCYFSVFECLGVCDCVFSFWILEFSCLKKSYGFCAFVVLGFDFVDCVFDFPSLWES